LVVDVTMRRPIGAPFAEKRVEMPTYVYRCECGNEFDFRQNINDPPGTLCPTCGSKTTKRLISGGGGIIFKGKGWPGKTILRKEQEGEA